MNYARNWGKKLGKELKELEKLEKLEKLEGLEEVEDNLRQSAVENNPVILCGLCGAPKHNG